MYFSGICGLVFLYLVTTSRSQSEVARLVLDMMGDPTSQRINIISVNKSGVSNFDIVEIINKIVKISLVRRLQFISEPNVKGTNELVKPKIPKYNQKFICFCESSLVPQLIKAGSEGYFSGDMTWILILRNNNTIDDLKAMLIDVDFYTNSEIRVAQYNSNESSWTLYEIWKIGHGSEILDNAIGDWSSSKGLNLFKLGHKFKRRKDFKGFHIRFTTSINMPYASVIKNGTDVEFDKGYCPDIWHTLQEQLNFTYSLSETVFGALQKNGLYDGMVGMIQRKESDVCGFLSQTTARQLVMDFTIPVQIISTRIFIKRPKLKAAWNVYVLPFDNSIWLCLPFFLIAAAFFLWLMNKIAVAHRCVAVEMSPLNAFWMFYSGFVQQSSVMEPKPISGKILFIFVFFIMLIIFTCYSGMLTSILATIRGTLPFKDLDDLCKMPEWHVGVRDSTATAESLSRAPNGTSPKCVWDKNVITNRKLNLFLTNEEGVQKILGVKNFAFFNIKEHLIYILLKEMPISEAVQIVDTGVDFFIRGWTFGTQKNSPFRDIMNYYLIKMIDEGHLQRLQRKWWPNLSREPDQEYPSPGLQEVFTLFLILSFGMILSLLVLACEIFRQKFFDSRFWQLDIHSLI